LQRDETFKHENRKIVGEKRTTITVTVTVERPAGWLLLLAARLLPLGLHAAIKLQYCNIAILQHK
jgi:hypothetical protein